MYYLFFIHTNDSTFAKTTSSPFCQKKKISLLKLNISLRNCHSIIMIGIAHYCFVLNKTHLLQYLILFYFLECGWSPQQKDYTGIKRGTITPILSVNNKRYLTWIKRGIRVDNEPNQVHNSIRQLIRGVVMVHKS
jgi:hypothetical protein